MYVKVEKTQNGGVKKNQYKTPRKNKKISRKDKKNQNEREGEKRGRGIIEKKKHPPKNNNSRLQYLDTEGKTA